MVCNKIIAFVLQTYVIIVDDQFVKLRSGLKYFTT